MDMKDLVENYIALRDKKSQLKAAYDKEVATIDAVMEKVEAVLLKQFNESGVESVRTEAGTAYKSTRTAASVADRDIFIDYVKKNDAFDLLEVRASKAAVEQFRSANDDLPPGINWREEQVVNIRRSA